MVQISIPDWIRKELPITTGFCEMINEALKNNPNMSLAEFATILNHENKRATYERIVMAERRQFAGGDAECQV